MSKFLLAGLLLMHMSCTTTKSTTSPAGNVTRAVAADTVSVSGAPVWVYKTKKDYRNYVPVILSADKSSIMSYPAPSDVGDSPDYLKPLSLKGGYLLDQKGIGPNVAFLKLTYEEYASLPEAPSRAELLNLVQDADPLTELCNCSNRKSFGDISDQINQLIEAGALREQCKVVK